jgi:hypothetical protein
MTKKTWAAVVVLVLFLVCISCAPGNSRFEQKPAGFFAGLWHGFICVFTFLIGLFSDSVNMYEVSNGGNWYDLGFLLGASMFLGGGGASSRKCKK